MDTPCDARNCMYQHWTGMYCTKRDEDITPNTIHCQHYYTVNPMVDQSVCIQLTA